MKLNNVGKKVAVVALSVCMLVVSHENEALAKSHFHAYSYWRTEKYYSSLAGTHPYYHNGKDETCTVYNDHYRDYFRCTCGAGKYENYETKSRHVNCGQ